MEGLGSNIGRLAQKSFLYLITNRKLFNSEEEFLQALSKALKAGVDIVQLREKDLDTLRLFCLSKKVRSLTTQHKALFLINDRVDIAMAVGADGVHLPGSGLPSKVARELLGPKAIIARSTHSLEEVIKEQDSGIDFLTFSPIFWTKSKAKYGPPQGIEKLKAVCRISHIPVVALGGINKDNAAITLSAGAKGISVISAILGTRDPFLATKDLKTILRDF